MVEKDKLIQKQSPSKKLKRLGIYFFYDPDGIVDRYIPVLLKNLVQNLDELLVVSNGPISAAGKVDLERITPHILERENRGMDVWAYKAALESYGWETMACFDEVVLLNYTIMGPVYDFKEMFDVMAERDIDFWGVTKHYGMDYDPYGKCKYNRIPEHIQTGFMAFRRSLVNSEDFRRYWEEMPEIRDYGDAICKHEAIFTEDFTRKGYRSDVYVNADRFKGYADYPLMFYARELIAEDRCPIFKRKTFYNYYNEYLDISCGQPCYELYEYLRSATDYDVDLVWETILRTAHMADIKDRMQLNYILPTEVELPKTIKPAPKVALFLHLYFMDLLDYCKRYAESMPSYADIYITTQTAEKKAKIEETFADFEGRRLKVILAQNRGREISAHLIELKPYYDQYDYICFAHDKKARHIKPYSVGESFSYHCFENILHNRTYVNNIITTFERNPRLGMLVPPVPLHSYYSQVVGNEWQANFENTKALVERLILNVPMQANKAPIAPLGGIYWYRPASLKPLFDANFSYDDFAPEPEVMVDGSLMHAIERVYPFVAQSQGYYSAWVINDQFQKIELTNFDVMMGDFNRLFCNKFGPNTRQSHLNAISHISALTNPVVLKKPIRNVLVKVFGESTFTKVKNKFIGRKGEL